jgi:hypothetical protein
MTLDDLGREQCRICDRRKNAKLVVYKGAPDGVRTTLKDKVNEELLAFIKT